MSDSYLAFASPFGKSTDASITTVICIDSSSSMAEKDYPPSRLKAASEASVALAREKQKHRPGDLLGIVSFSQRATRVLALTSVQDLQEIETALEPLRPQWSTNFHSGLLEVEAMFDEAAGMSRCPRGLFQRIFGRRKPGNKRARTLRPLRAHCIFLSDGDNNGRDPLGTADTLKEAGVCIDTIGIGGNPEEVNEKLLRDMASVDEQGNPRYRFIGDRSALIREFKKMSRLRII